MKPEQLKPAPDPPRPTIRPLSIGHVSLSPAGRRFWSSVLALCSGQDIYDRYQRGLFGPCAGHQLVENGIVEHALAFAEPASVRIYPGRFCKNPSGIMSMRIILVSSHRPTSRKLLCIRVGALSASRSSSRFIRLSVRVQHTMDASLIWGWHCLAAIAFRRPSSFYSGQMSGMIRCEAFC